MYNFNFSVFLCFALLSQAAIASGVEPACRFKAKVIEFYESPTINKPCVSRDPRVYKDESSCTAVVNLEFLETKEVTPGTLGHSCHQHAHGIKFLVIEAKDWKKFSKDQIIDLSFKGGGSAGFSSKTWSLD